MLFDLVLGRDVARSTGMRVSLNTLCRRGVGVVVSGVGDGGGCLGGLVGLPVSAGLVCLFDSSSFDGGGLTVCDVRCDGGSGGWLLRFCLSDGEEASGCLSLSVFNPALMFGSHVAPDGLVGLRLKRFKPVCLLFLEEYGELSYWCERLEFEGDGVTVNVVSKVGSGGLLVERFREYPNGGFSGDAGGWRLLQSLG